MPVRPGRGGFASEANLNGSLSGSVRRVPQMACWSADTGPVLPWCHCGNRCPDLVELLSSVTAALALTRTAWWFPDGPRRLAEHPEQHLCNRGSAGAGSRPPRRVSATPAASPLSSWPGAPPSSGPSATSSATISPPRTEPNRRATEGRDAVKAALAVADLRRVANHPATCCLPACLFTAVARRAQHPSRTPARKKPARLDGFPHGHGVGHRNTSVAAAHPHCRAGGRQEISPGWRGVRCTPARSGGTPRRRSGSARACRRGARTPPHRTCRPWRRPGAGRG